MAKNPRVIDMAGQICGQWTVLHQHGNHAKGGALWMCKCDCGTERAVIGADLRNGKSTGCGCKSAARIGALRRTHGDTRSRLYYVWANMRARCRNSRKHNFAQYGGRGITVCAEWNEYAAFQAWALSAGYADNLEIDRIDVDGHYTPDNCRWVDEKTQSRNRRMVKKTKDGTTYAEIAEANGIPIGIVNSRVASGGWDRAVAATRPVGTRLRVRVRDDSGKFAAAPKKAWRR